MPKCNINSVTLLLSYYVIGKEKGDDEVFRKSYGEQYHCLCTKAAPTIAPNRRYQLKVLPYILLGIAVLAL